ncbi:MAG: MBL fold metallo-hydrolase [Flavobacteriales bacterium]
MKITFVNHASFVVTSGDVKLIVDPWIEGTVFNNSWGLLAPTQLRYEDFFDITHIWFSHEHPDHFFPPNLNKIPEDARRKITVLYKQTLDGKIAAYCKKLGFSVLELATNVWIDINKDFSVLCHPNHDDSAMAMKSKQAEKTILNVNDCVFGAEQDLVNLAGLTGKIDVLLTQFSYASYAGETYEERRKQAENKYGEIEKQIKVFRPEYLIPMASYVYFCHEENFYMNDAINKVGDVFDFVKNKQVLPVVMFPGDEWIIGQSYNSEPSLKKWAGCYASIGSKSLVKTNSVAFPALEEQYIVFRKNLFAKITYIPLLNVFKVLKPVTIFLTDINVNCVLDLGSKTLKQISGSNCDIQMTSEVLMFCLKFDYGFNTTAVNGRFHLKMPDAQQKMNVYISLCDAANHGRVGYADLLKGIARRVYRKVRK